MTVIVSPLKFIGVLQYSLGFMRSMVQNRPLNLAPDNWMTYTTDFKIPAQTFTEWQKAIGNHDPIENRNTVYCAINTQAFFTCVSRLGIDFKTIMHLASEVHFRDICFQFEAERTYHYQARIVDVKPFPGHGRGILEIEVQILDGDEVKLVHVDRLFFRGVPSAVYEKMVAQKAPEAKYNGMSRRASALASNYESRTLFHVGRKLGVQYGMLSGDLNPIHTVELVSRLFRHPGSFIQGLCATNLVLSLLKDSCGLDVGRMEAIFASPLFCGQNYYLLVEGSRFEVVDDHNHVKVFGDFEDCSHLRRLMGSQRRG
ncbi:MAG TPA: MaoC/PaaZ C-terminal domain-containing protein [Oligoflexus sp.]|uniref:MaoC/PaaZ C-terminal domain-containing protein n=1 Tax=Oligoflexus sp. TaxID=1971216 RepID=UPI002D3A9066|nr:MaoC/PaaZ C-terminal domain-containing protein [Oligoflexus sp.]HYX38012.1 MaoC/PaaZ C-terminal domain-containing protein [Oligoflexus sp.]